MSEILPHDHITPFKESSKTKKEQVAEMFDRIAGRYDFMNRFLSARTDVGWRKKAIKWLKKDNPGIILDIATGTADLYFRRENKTWEEEVETHSEFNTIIKFSNLYKILGSFGSCITGQVDIAFYPRHHVYPEIANPIGLQFYLHGKCDDNGFDGFINISFSAFRVF